MNHSGDTNKMVGADHFPDATKMVSDTPRTDAEECEMFIGISTFTSGDVQQAFDFARQLERELAAANERIKRLEGELESTKADRDSWSNQSDEFAKTAADLIIHIKRLEEAGDALKAAHYFGGWADAVNKWNKSKEAKP